MQHDDDVIALPSRRRFLATTAIASTGLVIACFVPFGMRKAFAQDAPKPQPVDPNAFVRIGADDTVTVLLKHSEMGQGIWTSMPMVVAEELDCDWSRVRVEHAPAAPAYAHTAFGIQMTGGSTSTWESFEQLRTAGAMARAMLVQAAAAAWKVDSKTCRTENGMILSGTRKARYGEFAEAAAKLPPPKTVPLKDAAKWGVIGKPTRRVDSQAKVTGTAQFGIDIQRPGMLVGVVARPPVFGGKVVRVDAAKAKAVPGVVDVVQIPQGVAVLARHFWAAKQGREALVVEWDHGAGAAMSSAALRSEYQGLAGTRGAVAKTAGDVDAALGSAAHRVEAEYELPYLAHAPMEPLNCTVEIGKDGCEIWTGTQFQTGDQGAAAKALGLKPEQVKVHTPFLGGGFGRRANPASDFVLEAVHAAKAAGKPVKLVWTREDDIRGGYYRPMWLSRMSAGIGEDGKPSAWAHTLVGQSIMAGTPFEMMIKDGVDGSSVEGIGTYLASIPNHRVDLHSPKSPVTVLWWRSVGHSHTGFVVESFIDELAHAAKQDPLAYRLSLLPQGSRDRRALELAAAKFGWGKPLAKGRAAGLAVHESFGSHVAQVAEVSVEAGRIRVHRVVCAIDCGPVVNPLGVEAQIQSGIVYGLSAALYGKITFKDGKVEQGNFHDYPVLRLDAMPVVEVHIVPSTDKMGGVGEPGTPPIAPAVANAVFALTGKRLRKLPFDLA
ncbi:molybdopterin cofactor-binding domain-containing protein [Dokdonella sp. MW10]|uniref:xanthine dehydrogenase family protein molybdopterin-binding subunit n=1 Tax=Dokdonella sp. MW10 TaxID=2992926 RepID=UPI003F7D655F